MRWGVRAGVLLLLGLTPMIGCDRLFSYPSARVWYRPEEFGLAHEDVHIRTSDGETLHGWWLPAKGEALGTIVHFHGNAANVTNHVALISWMPPAGFNVLMFDYRGYGRSSGSVSRAGTILDGQAAMSYALGRHDVDRARVGVFGQSLGGAVATVVASDVPEVRAVVLDGTFSSYRRIAARHLESRLFVPFVCRAVAATLLSGEYEPVEHVRRIAPRPLLVIAAPEDDLCFPELGRELYEAAGEPRKFLLLSSGAHLDAVVDNVDGVQGIIHAFFRNAFDAASAPRESTSRLAP